MFQEDEVVKLVLSENIDFIELFLSSQTYRFEEFLKNAVDHIFGLRCVPDTLDIFRTNQNSIELI